MPSGGEVNGNGGSSLARWPRSALQPFKGPSTQSRTARCGRSGRETSLTCRCWGPGAGPPRRATWRPDEGWHRSDATTPDTTPGRAADAAPVGRAQELLHESVHHGGPLPRPASKHDRANSPEGRPGPKRARSPRCPSRSLGTTRSRPLRPRARARFLMGAALSSDVCRGCSLCATSDSLSNQGSLSIRYRCRNVAAARLRGVAATGAGSAMTSRPRVLDRTSR